jgi:hypothetical protein
LVVETVVVAVAASRAHAIPAISGWVVFAHVARVGHAKTSA